MTMFISHTVFNIFNINYLSSGEQPWRTNHFGHPSINMFYLGYIPTYFTGIGATIRFLFREWRMCMSKMYQMKTLNHMTTFHVIFIDGVMQKRRNCIANAPAVCFSCIQPSIYYLWWMIYIRKSTSCTWNAYGSRRGGSSHYQDISTWKDFVG